MRIAASNVYHLVEYANYRGIQKKHLLKLLSEQTMDLLAEESYVSPKEYCMIWNEFILLSKEKYLGLHYGFFLNLQALGSVYQVSISVTNIGQAILLWNDFSENNFPLVKIISFSDKGKFCLELKSDEKNLPAGKAIRKQILDMVFSFMYREIVVMTDNADLTVCVPYRDTEEYSKWYKCIVKTGKAYIIKFDQVIVAQEINAKRKHDLELLLPQFLQMIDKSKRGYKPFSIQVRKMTLNMCSPELPSFNRVVSQFAMSNRAFQRKLAAGGCSFRGIADEIKRELTTYLQKGNKMKTQDIAYCLGYTSSSAFLHAAKKWRMQTQIRPLFK